MVWMRIYNKNLKGVTVELLGSNGVFRLDGRYNFNNLVMQAQRFYDRENKFYNGRLVGYKIFRGHKLLSLNAKVIYSSMTQ